MTTTAAQLAARPRHAIDYQDLRQTVAAMSRVYEDGVETGWHSHRRGQLLCCESGFMTAQTMTGTFLLPRAHGLLIEPGIPHIVRAHGRVDMRTLYIEPDERLDIDWTPTRVIRVSRLLGALVEALLHEPVDYEIEARGGHLAALALDEIASAENSPFALPMPSDKRLMRLCSMLSADPAIADDIDDWALTLGMSRRTLTRHFRQETQMSFVEWRRRLRLGHVLRATAEGKRMDRAAAEVGYHSVAAMKHALRDGLDGVHL
ncbi:AraC family transcriptional regulator [Paracoccus aminophilus]|uniref:Transcriptional regulator, AraC family n=1 Tax=Paracoccus aminophilus JCM 7686 TaxID=1367847 RepID=S5XSZ3_PARAH|nr:helix-turn-helix transcriptional regulator [Paracoccus aminophilus]AGT08267.1 transcriptional regulator, AraC family [Paracoccus aminophilus JCM 7686]